MELRTRPKTDFLKTADWEQLYHLTNHWQSDLGFYRDELRFMRQLVNRYFKLLVDEENMSYVRSVSTKLLGLSTERAGLCEKVIYHLRRLMLLIENQENGQTEDDQDFREDHETLENEIAAFAKDLRRLKKKVFHLTEHIIEGEKLRHLLTS